MTTIDYRLFDADEHYYEPEDALTRHLDPKYRSAVRWVDMDGRRSLIIGGKLLQLIPNPTYDPVGRPGSLNSYFRAQNPEGRSLKEILGEPQPHPARVPRPRRARAGARRARRRVRLGPAEPRARRRGDAEGRPRGTARRGARLQHVARRRLGVRPRRSHPDRAAPDARRPGRGGNGAAPRDRARRTPRGDAPGAGRVGRGPAFTR